MLRVRRSVRGQEEQQEERRGLGRQEEERGKVGWKAEKRKERIGAKDGREEEKNGG